MINELTYRIFEEIEKRGLQFCIPDHWRPLYREYLKIKKSKQTEGSYKDDFGKTP